MLNNILCSDEGRALRGEDTNLVRGILSVEGEKTKTYPKRDITSLQIGLSLSPYAARPAA